MELEVELEVELELEVAAYLLRHLVAAYLLRHLVAAYLRWDHLVVAYQAYHHIPEVMDPLHNQAGAEVQAVAESISSSASVEMQPRHRSPMLWEPQAF